MKNEREFEIPQINNVPEVFPPSPPEIDTIDEPIQPEKPEKND